MPLFCTPTCLPPPRVSVDAVTLMINECMILSSSMRKLGRHQSGVAAILGAGDMIDELPSSLSSSSAAKSSDNPLLLLFLQLRSILTEASDWTLIDSLTLMQPFLLTIKLPATLGHVTALALGSVHKFLAYGVISAQSKNVDDTMAQIVTALTHCRFDTGDADADDGVLLKVVRLLELIMQSALAEKLCDDVVTEVVHTCLNLACNKKRSEVLRKLAEIATEAIAVRVFGGLEKRETEKESTEEKNDRDTKDERNESEKKSENNEAQNEKTELQSETTTETKTELQSETTTENKTETTIESESEQSNLHTLHQPDHSVDANHADSDSPIPSPEQFLATLVLMISPANQLQHLESTRVFALGLINTAVEVAGHVIPHHEALFALVSDLVSKHVLQIVTSTESPALLHAALRVFTTLAVVMGPQLTAQIELALSMICQQIVPPPSRPSDTLKGAAPVQRSPALKEALVEALLLLWARSATFFTDLFIDYDCDFDKSDLAHSMLEFLCRLALPDGAVGTTDAVPPICLESVLGFVSGVNERIKNTRIPDNLDGSRNIEKGKAETISSGIDGNSNGISSKMEGNSNDLPHHLPDSHYDHLDPLLLNKRKKTSFVTCANLLNENPKAGIAALVANGFIDDASNTDELAAFFFTSSGRLNKKVLGELLAKPSNVEVLRKFIGRFDLAHMRVDEALRILLRSFRLPGESQQIERIVETFAERYVECQSDEDEDAVRPDRDSVFILSYSIIMLNTDLHNPQVKKQMLLEDYKKNLRGVYNGKDFPEWYLAKIYSSIKEREIIMPEEHHGTDKWFDDAWNNLIATQKHTTRTCKYLLEAVCEFDRVLFETVASTVIDTLFGVFREASDDTVITRLMSLIDKCANICIYYGLGAMVDKLVGNLADLTGLDGKREVGDDAIPITQIRGAGKKAEIDSKDPSVDTITVSDTAVWFGRDFKAQLSTVVLFRLIKKSDCKVSASWNKVIRIILTLFENCLVPANMFSEFQRKVGLLALPSVKPRYIINRVKPNNNSGLLLTFSLFLKGYSDEPPEPTDQEIESTLLTIDCVKSVNIPAIFQMVSKGPAGDLKRFVQLLLALIPQASDDNKRWYETEVLFVVEVSVCFSLLLGDVALIDEILDKIGDLEGRGLKKNKKEIEQEENEKEEKEENEKEKKEEKEDGESKETNENEDSESKDDGESKKEQPRSIVSKKTSSRLLSYTLLLLRHTAAFSPTPLLETLVDPDTSKQGDQILRPLLSLVDDESVHYKTILSSELYWKVLRQFAQVQTHAFDLLEFVEGIVNNSSEEISPDNYIPILGLLDEISSLGAIGAQHEQGVAQDDEETIRTYEEIMKYSKRSMQMTAELGNVAKRPAYIGKELAYSLIQALAHQCFNPCREIRAYALKLLLLTVLSAQTTSEMTAVGLFEFGLFPLLSELSKPEVLQTDVKGFTRTQLETLSLLSKVFLKYNGELGDDFERLWMGILDNITVMKGINSDSGFHESVSETVKNMVLVLQANGVLVEGSDLWEKSWEKIDGIDGGLRKPTEDALENRENKGEIGT